MSYTVLVVFFSLTWTPGDIDLFKEIDCYSQACINRVYKFYYSDPNIVELKIWPAKGWIDDPDTPAPITYNKT